MGRTPFKIEIKVECPKYYLIPPAKLQEIFRLAYNDERFVTATGKIRHSKLADYSNLMWGISLKPRQIKYLFEKHAQNLRLN